MHDGIDVMLHENLRYGNLVGQIAKDKFEIGAVLQTLNVCERGYLVKFVEAHDVILRVL